MDEGKELVCRVEKLERSNRRLRAMLIVGILLAGIVVLMGSSSNQRPPVLEAQKLVLKDATGHERGSLFATEKGWGLVLYNSNSSKGAAFVVSEKLGSEFLLMDKIGRGRVAAWANEEGSNINVADLRTNQTAFELKNNRQGSALVFHDGNERDRVAIGLPSGSDGTIMFNDANSVTRTALTEDIGLAKYDAKGTFVWAAGWDGFSKEEKDKMRRVMQRSTPRH